MTLAPTGLLDDLTDAQQRAVTHMDGPLLVLAGPGSGKTTVVTRRVAHLVAQGIPAWQILALTFTNKAAGEMRDRIEARLGDDVPGRRGLTVATFHSFCARLLRRYADEASVAERYSIYDGADQRAAIKQALSTADLNERNFTPAAVGAAISRAKNRLLDAAAYASEASDFYTRTMARAYTAYEKILRSNDALDFDDLLLLVARLLREKAPVRDELQQRYQYVLVDEYQDTNHAQFVIANTLASEHRNICVVGDPDQSIYGWRGADIRNILEFEQHYPEAEVVPLGQNFRSTGHIVETADQLIRHNTHRKHKPLHTEREDGEKPQVIICRDEHHEAELIVSHFRDRQIADGLAWKDMAVLYRVNALSRVLEEAFRDAQIPYVIARGTAFYDRKEIKDALAYLRLVANPNDEVSLRRIINTPARGIGKTTLDRIESFALGGPMKLFDALRRVNEVPEVSARAAAAVRKFVTLVESWRAAAEAPPGGAGAGLLATAGDATPLADLVERVVRESGMEAMYRRSSSDDDIERLENLEELINAAAQFVPPVDDDVGPGVDPAAIEPPREPTGIDRLGAYLESVALVSDADMIDPANGAVTLMTLHAAKGLEFEAVAVVGLEDGLLPHLRAAESDMELEEERRLCFVGITRAKRFLLLTRATARTHRGIRERTIESQFLSDLPRHAVTRSDQGTWTEADDPFLHPDDETPSRGAGSPRDARRSRSLLAAFPAGTLVHHPKFGLGRVEAVTPRPAGSSARVRFDTVGVKTLILEYARLERVE
jgi:DNA helicase-2/ATP-dependent DNA helicase PcrA